MFNFNPCFLGFQLEFLCQTELLKREFQSLFSWILTAGFWIVCITGVLISILVFLDFNEGIVRAYVPREKRISILVFLDFNSIVHDDGDAEYIEFQSLFSWISTRHLQYNNNNAR